MTTIVSSALQQHGDDEGKGAKAGEEKAKSKRVCYLTPTPEAIAAGVKSPLPAIEDPHLAERLWVEGMKGPKAFRLSRSSTPYGTRLDLREAYLLANSVRREGREGADNSWYRGKPIDPYPDAKERDLLPRVVADIRSTCTDVESSSNPGNESDDYQITEFKPAFEAFALTGFYVDTYKIRWHCTGKEAWLDYSIENGDELDCRCTWEPSSCLSDPDSPEAQRAKLRWCDRTERLLALRADSELGLILLKEVGDDSSSQASTPVVFASSSAIELEQAVTLIAGNIDKYVKTGSLFLLEKLGEGKILDSQGNAWVACRSASCALFFSRLPLSDHVMALHPPNDDYVILPSRGKRGTEELRGDDVGLPPKKIRCTVVTSRALGEGTYGRVLRGQILESGLDVAVKSAREGVINEARILQTLRHRNVVACHAAERIGDEEHLVLEYMPTSLDKLIQRPEELEECAVLRYSRHLFSALDYCHALNLVHCDVKPANLLVRPDCKTLKLTDFGETGVAGSSVGRLFYSRWWRPPEVVFGRRARASSMDMWAAGAVLGEMVGRFPIFFSSGTSELVARILRLVTPGAPGRCAWSRVLGAEVDAARCPLALRSAEKCLVWNPNERESAREILEMLKGRYRAALTRVR